MDIPKAYKGRYFYHFTHIDNIKSIIECDGLLSTNIKKQYGVEHHNIANMDIQNRRREMHVPVGPGGVVHDYVPFYFATINPMLLGLLNRKIVDQPYICFIAVSVEKLLNSNVVFTDASANTIYTPNFYERPDDLEKLEWSLIDSMKWGENSEEERHLRMAEVLVYQKVPLEWIDSYIVFNKIGEKQIKNCYNEAGIAAPNISYDWFNHRPFFFTKFFLTNRKNETLITGPIQLLNEYTKVVQDIANNRLHNSYAVAPFENIEDILRAVEDDFCVLPELNGIFELKTDNIVHRETVSDHTIKVVNNIFGSAFYKYLSKHQRIIVEFAAYLHDIGKGPKEKWKNGIQPVYPDHSADAIPMLARILSEDINEISEKEIQTICLLVIYHDLMGDIIGKGRSMDELSSLCLKKTDLYMLATLAEADIRAVGAGWEYDIVEKLENLIERIEVIEN